MSQKHCNFVHFSGQVLRIRHVLILTRKICKKSFVSGVGKNQRLCARLTISGTNQSGNYDSAKKKSKKQKSSSLQVFDLKSQSTELSTEQFIRSKSLTFCVRPKAGFFAQTFFVIKFYRCFESAFCGTSKVLRLIFADFHDFTIEMSLVPQLFPSYWYKQGLSNIKYHYLCSVRLFTSIKGCFSRVPFSKAQQGK